MGLEGQNGRDFLKGRLSSELGDKDEREEEVNSLKGGWR